VDAASGKYECRKYWFQNSLPAVSADGFVLTSLPGRPTVSGHRIQP
jgi:hypothetical protein